jgi:eukaryotic-like serine/threonine-protein kinase
VSDTLRISDLPQDVWRRVSDLFDEVIELAESERIAYVRKIWAQEPAVAKELMALLVAAANADKAPRKTQKFNTALSEALAEPVAGYATGRKFGAWTLDNRIGRGGMGEVWRAKRSDGLYKADAAIKLLRTDLSQDKLSRRFARERTVLARLNHPNIARLLDAGVDASGQAYIVLELVDGVPLLDYVKANAPTLNQRLRLVRDVALAVEHAHHQHVLHRDLKPSNVLVTKDGQIKLLDFGIAGVLDTDPNEPMTKLTQLTGRGLTLEYASPEQVTGDPTMPASDVYSLGVVLFHLCTGNRPFAATSTRAALEYAVANSDPPLASETLEETPTQREIVDQIPAPSDKKRLRGDLDEIIRRAMRLAPEARYPTAAALAADIDAWLSGKPTSRHTGDRGHAARLWFKRHWYLVTVVATSLVVLLAVLGMSLWQRKAALEEAMQAREEAVRLQRVNDAVAEILQRVRATTVANPQATPETHQQAFEQARRDAELRLANDAAARELLRKQLDRRGLP